MGEFGFSEEELQEAEELAMGKVGTREICACGHPISRHRFNPVDNKYECQPNAMSCPCIQPRVVMKVTNERYFIRKSTGSGPKHALSLGYIASKNALGEDFVNGTKWLIPKICDRCGEETEHYPVRVSKTGKLVFSDEQDQGVTVFYCPKCRDPRNSA